MGEIVMLRLVHVVGGVFWVGSMMYLTFFLMPAMADIGPAAGQLGAAFQRRKVFVWLPLVALLTILAGLRLLMIDSASFASGYFATNTGKLYLGGGIAAIVAFLIGVTVNRPAMTRLTALGETLAGADEAARARIGAEMAALRARSGTGAKVVTWLLIIAAATMAVARYV